MAKKIPSREELQRRRELGTKPVLNEEGEMLLAKFQYAAKTLLDIEDSATPSGGKKLLKLVREDIERNPERLETVMKLWELGAREAPNRTAT